MKAKIINYASRKYAEVEHEILYIEYRNGLPFDVWTAYFVPEATNGAYWRLCTWDFFKNQDDPNDIRYYMSGSGGRIEDGIDAPHFCSPIEVWLSDKIKFIGQPTNIILLKKPKGNPFNDAEQSLGYTHCEQCGMDVDDCMSNELLCGCGKYNELGGIDYN